jgi:hypothetical protein
MMYTHLVHDEVLLCVRCLSKHQENKGIETKLAHSEQLHLFYGCILFYNCLETFVIECPEKL